MDAALDQALRAVATKPAVLVALDFDGTLAPIVTRPEDARSTPAGRRAVERLAAADGVTVAIVSGRPREELRRIAQPPDGVVLVGSHGAQRDTAQVDLDDARRELLDRVAATLEEVSAGLPHTRVERKAFAAALHTRPALEAGLPQTFDRAWEATSALRRLPDVHLTEGKEVLEFSVVDPGRHNKGVALRELVRSVGADAALFIGDDTTDEAGFAVLDDDAGDVTIKVAAPGNAPVTRARHTVADPDEVAAVLERLAALRGVPAW